jgi:hypothetical protein
VQLDEVPMPSAVASRPRDARGYPVLAITPWPDGVPNFGLTSTERVLVCAVERRCAVCGTPLGDRGAWRVVAADEAVAILDHGADYANAAPTVEPPGHRACMLYAAMICPFLVRPNARRGQDATIADFTASRGEARGERDGIGGAVVGFAAYEFRVDEFVRFHFAGLIAASSHRLGDEHMAELQDAIAAEPAAAAPCPAYLLEDDSAARTRAAEYM